MLYIKQQQRPPHNFIIELKNTSSIKYASPSSYTKSNPNSSRSSVVFVIDELEYSITPLLGSFYVFIIRKLLVFRKCTLRIRVSVKVLGNLSRRLWDITI
eukprot:UN27274